LLPTILVASPASVRPVAQYLLRLTKQGLRYSDVVTRVSLERATNRSGIKFPRLMLTTDRVLEPMQRSRMRAVVATLVGGGAARTTAASPAAPAPACIPGDDDVGTVDLTTEADVPPAPVDEEVPF